MNQEDTYLNIYVNCKNYDSIFEDDYNVNLHWEVRTTSAQAHKVAVRTTTQIYWFDKPFIGTGILESNYEDIMHETLDFYRGWATEKVQEYHGEREARTEPVFGEIVE